MKAETPLEYAVFQLTPTRTRCELLVSAGGVTEKLASGLLKPFLAHLRAAEEQIAQGGYSIRLDPIAAGVSNGVAPWFSKGTMERFVRFVSTPEVLERVSTVEAELVQLEEAIGIQSKESSRADDASRNAPTTPPSVAKQFYGMGLDNNVGAVKQLRRDSVDASDVVGESSKRRLLRAMDARRLMLQKEQGMAFARASAAGFDMDHMNDLMIFAECFGAFRLREACLKFIALCKKRQEAGLWVEELDLIAADAGSMGPDKHEAWSDVHSESGDTETHEESSGKFPNSYHGEGKGYSVEDMNYEGHGQRRRVQQMEASDFPHPHGSSDMNGELSSSYRTRGKPHYGRDADQVGVGNSSSRFHADEPLMGPRPSLWQQQSGPPVLQPPSLAKFAGHRLPVEGVQQLDHAAGVGGEFRDADTGRLLRPRATWAMHSPRPLPNYGYRGDGEAYDSWAYEAGYSGGRVSAPHNYHYQGKQGNLSGFPDTHSSPDKFGEQHRQSGERYAEATNYADPSHSGAANFSPQESSPKDMQSPTNMITNKHLARRSTSPKRRSPSPLRKVQIGRHGARRSGMVVIRNINYITSNPQDRSSADKAAPEGPGDDEQGSELGTDSDGDNESLARKAESVRMSVKDAISLFEAKKKDPAAKKKSGKKDSRRGSVESAGSGVSQSNSFKRWGGGSEVSTDSNFQSQDIELEDDEYNAADSQISSDEKRNVVADGMAMRASKPSASQAGRGSDPLEEEFNFSQGGSSKAVMDDMSTLPDRYSHGNGTRGFAYFNLDEKQGDMSEHFESEELLMMPEREGSKMKHGSDVVAGLEAGPKSGRQPVADDSYMLSDRGQPGRAGFGQNLAALNPDLDLTAKSVSNHGFKSSLIDDSFMVSAHSAPHEQSKSSWRTAVNMESEMPSSHFTSIARNEGRTYEPEDVLMLPERNSGKDSLGRAWDAMVDYDAELLNDGQHVQEEEDGSVADDGGSPKSQKGRFYEQYREKRDAKLREVSGPKRAEREAKLKAMQEVLERRKAEMVARTGRAGDKNNSMSEAQARADKLRAYKAGLAKTKKDKEDDEKKRLEEIRAQRRERIAARNSPTSVGTVSASSTPRASLRQPQPPTPKPNIVRKLSPTPQKAAASASTPRGNVRGVALSSPRPLPKNSPGQRRPQTGGGQSDNPLSRSVPSLSELRKENTKPSGGRIGFNSLPDGNSVPASKSSSHVSRPKPSAEAALLEANGGVPAPSRVSRVGADERKRGVTSRRSLSGAAEARIGSTPVQEKSVLGPLKISKDILAEPPVTSKFSRRLPAPSQDSKPFLRKGSGIGPGAGPGVRKLKESLAEAQKIQEDDAASNADTASVLDAPSTPMKLQVREVEALISDSAPASGDGGEDQDGERAGVGPGLTAIRAPASAGPGSADANGEEETGDNRDFSLPAPQSDSSRAAVVDVPGSPAEKHVVRAVDAATSPYKDATHWSSQKEFYDAPYAAMTRSPFHPLTISTPSQGGPPLVELLSPTPSIPPAAPGTTSSPLPVKKTLLEALTASEAYVAPLAPASASPSRGEVYARVSDAAADVDFAYAVVSASPSHNRSPHFMAASEQYSAPIALASASPAASPASHSLPQLRHTVSPNLESVKSAVPASKKAGGLQKPPSSNQQSSKEAQKSGGLKRLLKFGRKSTGSASSSSISNSKSDWVSEGDDEADDASYADSKPQGKGSKSHPLNGKNSKSNVGYGSDCFPDTIHEDRHNDYNTSSVRSSIPAPPANFKLREDHLPSGSLLKAPRSFFSLSSFRSKGSEGRYRA